MRTAKSRLASYRASAEKGKSNYGESSHYANWRSWMTRTTKHFPKFRPDEKEPGKVYVDSLKLGWRECGDSHDIVRLRHNGWYADNDQNGLLKGCVLQLPSRNGEPRYVPATYCTEWDGATIYMGEIGPDKEQAARYADRNAEIEAESSREFYAKDEAEQQIVQKREEIHELNKEALELLREIKGQTFTPAVCGALKSTLQALLRDRRACFKRIGKLQEDFWLVAPN